MKKKIQAMKGGKIICKSQMAKDSNTAYVRDKVRA